MARMATWMWLAGVMLGMGGAGCVGHGHGHGHGHGEAQTHGGCAAAGGDGELKADQLAALGLARLPQASGGHGHRFDRALACAEQALRLSPDHPDARYVVGLAQLDRHAFRAALTTARKVLASRPDHVGALLLASDAQLELGNLAGAEHALAAALSLRPSAAALVRAAHLRHLQGDNEGALGLYRQALQWSVRGRDLAVAHWAAVEMAAILQQQGDTEGARAGLAWARTLQSTAP